MIRCNILGFTGNEADTRYGDYTHITDGKNDLIIDGYMSIGATRVISRLKSIGVKEPYLAISHTHDDHTKGIRMIINDGYFKPKALYCYDPATLSGGLSNSEIRDDVNTLNTIISEAKRRYIPVIFIDNGDKIQIGEINIEVYREQPAYKGASADPHGWIFMNDGSLVFYFPDLLYLTSGDGSDKIGNLCKQYGLHPVFFKIPHHGNACDASQARIMKDLGTKFCWDNDTSGSYTTFLSTGRKRCIEAGMEWFSCIGDINFVAFDGKVVIYKGSQHFSYAAPYKGKNTLKYASLAAVKNVLKGTYGNGDTRITRLLDAGFSPTSVQNNVNEILKLLN